MNVYCVKAPVRERFWYVKNIYNFYMLVVTVTASTTLKVVIS